MLVFASWKVMALFGGIQRVMKEDSDIHKTPSLEVSSHQ